MSKPLAKLINFSFSEAIFPNLLKFGNVIKKGDNLDYNNYIPISLILNIGKEILIWLKYIFWNKVSTNHALSDITNRIQEAYDKGQYAFETYVDFKNIWYS